MYDYGMIRFVITLRSKNTGGIIITRILAKNIQYAKRDVLKTFTDVAIVEIKFIEYVSSKYVRKN